MKVLAVDDRASALDLLVDTIRLESYQIFTALTGPSCLEVAARELPDVVLLDVMLPGMSGFETCQRLRAMPRLRDSTIIMVTALHDRESRIAAFEAGADDFLTKPFDRLELRLRLRTLARLNRFRRLLEQQTAYEDLTRISPDGILALDGEGAILQANPAAAALLGGVVGRPLGALTHPDDEPLIRGLVADVLSGGSSTRRCIARTASATSEYVSVEMTMGRVALLSGRQRLSVVLRDVSQELELQRLERSSVLHQAWPELAHDVSNYLLVSQMAIRRAIRPSEQCPESVVAALESARTAILQATDLLQSVKQFDRPAGRASSQVDLNEEIRQAEPVYRYLTRGVDLQVELSPDPVWLAVPAVEIRQVVSNLLSNARAATADGGRIVLRTYAADSGAASAWTFIQVSDDGVGISQDRIRHIFEPYFTTHADSGGTGLGLSSVHRVVLRHGGTVEVDSAEGRGSTFTIGFPSPVARTATLTASGRAS